MCQQCQRLLKAIDAYIQMADDDLKDQLSAEGFEAPAETVGYATELEDELTDALEKETEHIVDDLRRSKGLKSFRKKWPQIKAADTVAADISASMSATLKDFLPKYVDRYLKATDAVLICDRLSERSIAWIDSWSKELGEIMKLTSHNEIQSILDKGLAEGSGVEEVARCILESGIRDERYKARRAALTEVLTAHRVAQQEAFMQSPSVEEKEWMHTGAYRNEPRQNHVDMNGQRVPKASRFTLIGADGATYYPLIPGDTSLPPGERINCHCICQPIVNEDVLGLSIEERRALQQQAIDEMDDEWERELDARNKAKAGIDEETP
ncbi:MAG: hypothetical protein II837_04945 [Treponema sp.]|nr:hypothetical protein [Treponema sp.]